MRSKFRSAIVVVAVAADAGVTVAYRHSLASFATDLFKTICHLSSDYAQSLSLAVEQQLSPEHDVRRADAARRNKHLHVPFTQHHAHPHSIHNNLSSLEHSNATPVL